MSRTFNQRVSNSAGTVVRLSEDLAREMAPVVAFFFVAFALIFLLFKLFVAQYSIEFSAFSRAAIAALIMGKVIPLLDWAQSGYRFAGYRRGAVIAIKTATYGVVVVIIGIGDKIVRNVREAGSLSAGIARVIANANLDRFLGLVLLVCMVLGSFLTLQEISRAMGKGALLKLFFKPPANPSSATSSTQ